MPPIPRGHLQYRYSTAIPPAAPYSEWDLTQIDGGRLTPDYIPDMNTEWKPDPLLEWVGEPRVDGSDGLPPQVWILVAIVMLVGLLTLGLALALRTSNFALIASGAGLLSFGLLPFAMRWRMAKAGARTSGRSSMSCPGALELRTIEEALRAALQRSGVKLVRDHRRGELGRGFEWHLDHRMRLSVGVPGRDALPWMWLRTRGLENRRAHQVLKGHIQAAITGLPATPKGVAQGEAAVAPP